MSDIKQVIIDSLKEIQHAKDKRSKSLAFTKLMLTLGKYKTKP